MRFRCYLPPAMASTSTLLLVVATIFSAASLQNNNWRSDAFQGTTRRIVRPSSSSSSSSSLLHRPPLSRSPSPSPSNSKSTWMPWSPLAMAVDPDSSEEEDRTKETTWDRITGPKLFKTVTNWNVSIWYQFTIGTVVAVDFVLFFSWFGLVWFGFLVCFQTL